MPWFEPEPPEHEHEDAEWPVPDWDNRGLLSEQFIVTDNPIVGVLFGPKGELLAVYHERDDRFGFGRWAEDR